MQLETFVATTAVLWKIEESKQNETFYCHSWCKCTEMNLVQWSIFFSAYFISVYVSFIIVKNCGFVMGFVIFAIYFRLNNTIFNVKT